MRHFVGQTRNGLTVTVDLIHSTAAKHIARQPHLLSYAKEIVGECSPKGSAVVIEHDMEHPVGYSPVIATTPEDAIFYAQLIKETAYTRFVKKSSPQHTQYITLLLQRISDGSYALEDIQIGHFYPPQPGTDDEADGSKTFWATHAFVFDNQPLQYHSLTKTEPY